MEPVQGLYQWQSVSSTQQYQNTEYNYFPSPTCPDSVTPILTSVIVRRYAKLSQCSFCSQDIRTLVSSCLHDISFNKGFIILFQSLQN
jgi:hypothetical protein